MKPSSSLPTEQRTRVDTGWRAGMILLGFALGPFQTPLEAGEIVATYVYKQKEPNAARGQKRQRGVERYTVTLGSTDKVRRATRVEVLLEFFDGYAKKVGERTVSYEVDIEPDGHDNIQVECTADPLCHDSYSLTATVRKTDWQEVRFGQADEVVFEWNERRWFLENRWASDRRLVLRSFSRGAYLDQPFDGKIFAPGEAATELRRYYRVAKDALPTGFASDSTAYEVDHYWSEILPGWVVDKGQRRKPKLLSLDESGISNAKVRGEIAVGEYVQMRQVGFGKKGVDIVVAPVCDGPGNRRSLRGHVYFVLAKEVMSGPDYVALEGAIRPWFEPVSISTVAERCGPNSGTPVVRWDATTAADQIEAVLGPAAARAATGNGETLVFGQLKLRFAAGRLAGVERRTAP
jgi:hypothetical protein